MEKVAEMVGEYDWDRVKLNCEGGQPKDPGQRTTFLRELKRRFDGYEGLSFDGKRTVEQCATLFNVQGHTPENAVRDMESVGYSGVIVELHPGNSPVKRITIYGVK